MARLVPAVSKATVTQKSILECTCQSFKAEAEDHTLITHEQKSDATIKLTKTWTAANSKKTRQHVFALVNNTTLLR